MISRSEDAVDVVGQFQDICKHTRLYEGTGGCVRRTPQVARDQSSSAAFGSSRRQKLNIRVDRYYTKICHVEGDSNWT